MTFTRVAGAAEIYRALPTVYIDAIDSMGIIRAGKKWEDTITVTEYSATITKEKFTFGAVEIIVPRGNYLFSFEIGDPKTPRVLKFKSELEKCLPLAGPYVDESPIFVKPLSGGAFSPFIANDNIPFAKEAWAIVSVMGYPAAKSFTYSLEKIGPPSLKPPYPTKGDGYTVTGGAGVRRPAMPLLTSISKKEGINIRILTEQNNEFTIPKEAGVLVFPFPINELEEGTYRLLLYSDKADTINRICKVSWEDKPLSLRSMDYALNLLSMIATDAELQKIKSDDPIATEKAFLQYWKQRDPSRGTVYNEALATFYRRADFAYFNFQTLQQRDGTKTDRGKVYILYGKPTDIIRGYTPENIPSETWRYENDVRKQCLFVADRPGEFILRDMINIDEEQARK
jgi:GWxTD domain-containing protein